jgi:hypothetical protein
MNTRDKRGRFIKGRRYHPETEFKKGEHWREHQPFWERDWLYTEYVTKERAAADIAKQFGITEAAIFFWLRKHKIPRRKMTEIRAKKHWGLSGAVNGMYGKTGAKNPHWLGGVTPERQAVYSSIEWADAARQVWRRDKGSCRRCGKKKNGREMHIHHIVSFAIKELRTDPKNLVLLCDDCHKWVHSRKNKNQEFIRKEVI